MEGSFENRDELISRYLAGEADAEDAARLDSWRKADPENEAYFVLSKKLFDAVQGVASPIAVDVDKAWQTLDARIETPGAKIIPLFSRGRVLRVAASLLLLVALGFISKWLFTGNTSPATTLVAGNTTREQNLPDGSKVFMNKNTELAFVQEKGQRRVKLKGEAFFEVIHNDEQPFVIEVNEVLIKDIGTAFNVKALPGSDIIEVLVESGEVQFYSEISEGLTLVKGEKAVYKKSDKTFTRLNITAADNSMSYKSKVFHFENVPLKDVISTVNEVYGCNIRLADEHLGNCRLSVEFNNEDINVLVSVIAETLDLEVEQKSDSITLKGSVCPD